MAQAAAATRPGARDAHGAPARATGACFHCGEALPAEPVLAVVGGTRHPFCCSGCAAASAWIQDAGLSDYYALRTANGARVDLDPAALDVWDAPSVQAEHVRAVEGGCEITLIADGMHCAACAWLIDNALAREPGVREATANAMTGRLRLVWDPAATRLSQPLQRLRALGYTPCLATGAAREQAKRRERNRDLIRIGIAGLGTMQAMMFAEALYLDTGNTMSGPMRDFLRWITFLVSTPVVFYAGWTFLSGAWRELRLRRPGMDTLVATSTLLAYFASVWETITHGPHVWYDAAVMFVFLLLAARLLEQRARRVANAQVDALARARPVFATREAGDGSHEAIPLAALEAGDIAYVAAGDTVPADGTLLDAPALLEEALLTGESRPVERQAGETVLAGSIAHQRPLRMQVTATGTGTRLSHLIRLVEDAQAHRPPLARMADRIAAWFVVGMLLAAAAVYVAWRVHDPSRAFEVALALLVISCPCALSLAVPAALAAAHGALARDGVLATRPDALQRLAAATDVVFDKTGTLSDGHPQLEDIATFAGLDADTALRIATALERGSRHPLAQAFEAAAQARGLQVPHASDASTQAGLGLAGSIDGRAWRLGRADFAAGREDDGRLWLGDGATAFAAFRIGERLRDDAPYATRALRAMGLSLHLASGDARDAVARAGEALGIADAHARLSPEDKLARVRALQADRRHVAMVGDGINDAPVLAAADVAIAIGDGAALAHRSADLVLAAPVLGRIPRAIALARRTQRITRENFAWALGYNAIALPLAALGWVTPWLAALGMAVSSLTVTLNALRLTRRPAA